MIEPEVRQNLLRVIDAYAKATGMTLPVISKRFYGNRAFLGEFKAGNGNITLAKVDDLLAKFRESWPKETDWPLLRPVWM